MLWIWRQFRIELPHDWEMLQYSRSPKEGRCAFGDRYQIVMEFSWRQIPEAPDSNRMIDEYVTRLQQNSSMKDLKRIKEGKWNGIKGSSRETLTTRFVKYFFNETCIVQIVFVWPHLRYPKIEKTILSSVKEERKKGQVSQRWCAFGMDMNLSNEFDLQTCKVEPAHAQMTFALPKSKKTREEFRRIGLVSEWLAGPLRSWLKRQVPENFRILKAESMQAAGHDIEKIHAVQDLSWGARLIKKSLHYRGAAWICPKDGRIYYAGVQSADPKDLSIAGKKLTCCNKLTQYAGKKT